VEAHGDADLCGHALSLCTVALASPEAAGQRPLRKRFLERLLEAGVLQARRRRPGAALFPGCWPWIGMSMQHVGTGTVMVAPVGARGST